MALLAPPHRDAARPVESIHEPRPSLFKSINEERIRRYMSIIDGLFARRYANAVLCHLETTDTEYAFLWEKLNYCTLSFLTQVKECLGDPSIINEILVWNACEPNVFETEYQPISVEVRILRKPVEKTYTPPAVEHDDSDRNNHYLPRSIIDKKYFDTIKNKTLRQNIISAINAIYTGDDPSLYRVKFGIIKYHYDSSMDTHCVMIDRPPTFRYTFLKALKNTYTTFMSEIRFETIPDKERGMLGTCIILTFPGTESGIVKTNKPRVRLAGKPY